MKPLLHIIKRAINSEFLRNTSTLATGTTFAQLIPIIIQPFLRRYYSAETFGTYAVYLSLIGILYAVSSLRYEQAIIVPVKEREAGQLLIVGQIFNLIFSCLLTIIILIFKNAILNFLNIHPKHYIYLLLVPAGILLFNLQQSISLWLIRKKSFLQVSAIKIVRRGTEGIFQLVFRYLKYTTGLLIGDLIGHIMNIAVGLRILRRNGFRFSWYSFPEAREVAKKYSDYPKYNSLTAFLSAFSLLFPVILINKYYGSANAGFFDLSRLLLLTPIALLAGSVSNVILQRVAEKKRLKKSFKNEFFLILGIGFLISLVEVIVLQFFGEELFSVLFGKEWEFSGTISKLLIWPFLAYFFSVSLGSTFLALEKIKLLSFYQAVNFILTISLLLFINKDFLTFIKFFVVISMASSAIFFYLLARITIYYHTKTNQ